MILNGCDTIPITRMQNTLSGKTSSSGGGWWSGFLRSCWCRWWGAIFMPLRNRRSIQEYSIIERMCGIWLWNWVLKTCSNKTWWPSKRMKCEDNVQVTTLHLRSSDWFLRMKLSDPSWHSTESCLTTKIQHRTRNLDQLIWCWRTWNRKCKWVVLASPSSITMK